MPSPRCPHALPLPALLVGALVACQPTSDSLRYGQEQVDTCAAEACATLNLDGLGMRDFSQINTLSHVTSLMVSHTSLNDLTDIAGMAQLRELHIGSTGARDLSGLSAFPNLELLHMQYVEPQSYAPIAQLSNLRELAIGTGDLRDLSFVADMPGLQRLLVIESAPDLGLITLGAHRGLRTVDIRGVGSRDLSGLLALPNLREVSLTGMPYTIGPAQTQVIAQLRARGVAVELVEVAIIVC